MFLTRGWWIAIAAGVLVVTQASLRFETQPSEPATLAVVAGLLTAVALAASLIPARRAASIDPSLSLRHD